MKQVLMAVAAAGVLMLVVGCGGELAKIGDIIGGIPAPVTGLPSGHTLTSGTIPPGESRTILQSGGMRTTITCPSGGAACNVTVAPNGTATYTGGRPAVATAPIPGDGDPPPGGGGVIPPGLSISRSAWERGFLADWPSINNWSAFRGLQPWIPPSGARISTGFWLSGTFQGSFRNETYPDRNLGEGEPYGNMGHMSLQISRNATETFYRIGGGLTLFDIGASIAFPDTPLKSNGTWDSRENRLESPAGLELPDWGGGLYSSRGANLPTAARGWVRGRQDYSRYDRPREARSPTGHIDGVWSITGLDP